MLGAIRVAASSAKTGRPNAGAADGAAAGGGGAPAITEEEMRWWLEYMAATGRADFVWMALRAFGFDGRGDETQEEGAH